MESYISYSLSDEFTESLHDEGGQEATEVHDQWDGCNEILSRGTRSDEGRDTTRTETLSDRKSVYLRKLKSVEKIHGDVRLRQIDD